VDDEVILKEYNEVLIRKLEHKMLELEKVNKELEAEIEARKQAEEEIQSKLDELRRWYAATLDREDRVLEMKKDGHGDTRIKNDNERRR
jgi:hypothetical protein